MRLQFRSGDDHVRVQDVFAHVSRLDYLPIEPCFAHLPGVQRHTRHVQLLRHLRVAGKIHCLAREAVDAARIADVGGPARLPNELHQRGDEIRMRGDGPIDGPTFGEIGLNQDLLILDHLAGVHLFPDGRQHTHQVFVTIASIQVDSAHGLTEFFWGFRTLGCDF